MSLRSAVADVGDIAVKRWRPWFRPLIVAVVTAASAAMVLNVHGGTPDFQVFWTAAANFNGPVYDTAFLTPLQTGQGAGPFGAPPTFLLLILPLGLLPIQAAYFLWVTLSTLVLVEFGAKLTRYSWVALISPFTMYLALAGQSTVLVAALVAGAFGVRNPSLSGVMLGLAACMKPHLLVLVPLVLMVESKWVEFQAMIVTGIVLCLAATLAFGLSIWVEWLSSLSEFVAINDSLGITRVGLPFPLSMLALAAGVWFICRNRNDVPKTLVAALSAALLISPHGPRYDVAVLIIPGIAAAGLSWRLAPLGYLMFMIVNSTTLALVAAALSWPPKSSAGALSGHGQHRDGESAQRMPE